jgi:methanogenic corrinoid protein MtbC1
VAARTDGGHRRITLQEAVRFIRETGAPLARPELLDMPDISAVRAGDDAFRHYLVEGDATSARGWLLARYLSGASVASLCDGPIKEAMHRIGELWQHDPEGIFIEHRATDACIQALAQLRATFEPSPTAPFALGATPEDDPYLVPAFMAAMIVASEGLRSVNLGPDTPVGAMQRAYAWHKPTLVWVSASAPLPPERSRAIEQWLLTLPSTTVVLVGGRPVTRSARVGCATSRPCSNSAKRQRRCWRMRARSLARLTFQTARTHLNNGAKLERFSRT